jgi:methylated-DNA-[protein]-cysteine S-methyltransferase
MEFTKSQKQKLELLTPFQRAVLKECAKIPKGKTCTYSQIAKAIGKPKAARAVGNALAKNPFAFGREQLFPRSRARKNPLAPLIPCHRVVRSDGSLGGYSAKGGVRAKALLLKLETNV